MSESAEKPPENRLTDTLSFIKNIAGHPGCYPEWPAIIVIVALHGLPTDHRYSGKMLLLCLPA